MYPTPRAAVRIAAALALAAPAALAADDPLAPFPPPEPGQQRYVIDLDERPDEALHRVELLVGATREVDCNRQQFTGTLSSEVVQGWGYTYHVASGIQGPAGTLMACPPDSRREAFVSLGGGPHWVHYNSRLPVVVYVPDGFELRYRVWSAAQDTVSAQRR